MNKNYTFPKDVEDRLLEYMKKRESETGRPMDRADATVELLRTALAGYDPPKPLEERLSDIERRLRSLEIDAVQSIRLQQERSMGKPERWF